MKLDQIRKNSSEELKNLVATYKRELFAIRYRAAAGDISGAHKSNEIRKTIARILTVLKERQQAGGSN